MSMKGFFHVREYPIMLSLIVRNTFCLSVFLTNFSTPIDVDTHLLIAQSPFQFRYLHMHIDRIQNKVTTLWGHIE